MSGLGSALQALFVGWILLGVATIVALLIERDLLQQIRDNSFFVPLSDLEASDARLVLLAVISFLMYLATGVVFLVWFNRCYKNLESFGARTLRRSSGWSVGGWFIPFANLAIPYQTARDIWIGSDPQRNQFEHRWWDSGSSGALVKWWWALWIVSAVTSRWPSSPPQDVDGLLAANTFVLAGTMIGLASAIAALLFVRATTARQEQRALMPVAPSNEAVVGPTSEAQPRPELDNKVAALGACLAFPAAIVIGIAAGAVTGSGNVGSLVGIAAFFGLIVGVWIIGTRSRPSEMTD